MDSNSIVLPVGSAKSIREPEAEITLRRVRPSNSAFEIAKSGTKSIPGSEAANSKIADALIKYEAAIISQFLDLAMKDTNFGFEKEGMASSIFKSQFASAVSDQIAQSGGLGIVGLLKESSQVAGREK